VEWTKLLKTPLPTVLVVLGVALAIIAAAGGLHWGTFALPQLDTSGRIGLGALAVLLCAAGFYLRKRSGTSEANNTKNTLTITFDEILGPGAQNANYDFIDLTTVDALIEDLYRKNLQGAVSAHSYGDEWILATNGGQHILGIGPRSAKGQDIGPEPGLGVPIDERVVTTLSWFKQGGRFRVQRLERPESGATGLRSRPPIAESPGLRTGTALPEITNIRLKPGCNGWQVERDKCGFERNLDYEFAEDPVFEITVQNNFSSTVMLYEAGVHLLRRELGPYAGATMGEWEYRTREAQDEVIVTWPEVWKRAPLGAIEDRNSRASKPFVKPIEMNEGGSRYLFTLKLENFIEKYSSTSCEVRFFLVTENNRLAESISIWLSQ
jgi:hypothetical protein